MKFNKTSMCNKQTKTCVCVCIRVLYDMNIFLQHLAQNDGNEAEDAFKYLTEEKDEGCENRET